MGVHSNSMRSKNNKLLCKPDIPAKGKVRLNHFHKFQEGEYLHNSSSKKGRTTEKPNILTT